MSTIIYLIRHSGPFVPLENIQDEPFESQNKKMILSVEAEEKAKKLCEIEDLKNVDKVFSCNSARAIATVKYIAYKNDMKINVTDEINERVFGIEYINEIPKDFIKRQFEDINYKLNNGESLLEVRNRINNFIEKILLKNRNKKIVISLHAIALMAYIQNFCNIIYNDSFKIIYNDKVVFDEDNRLVNIENIKISY